MKVNSVSLLVFFSFFLVVCSALPEWAGRRWGWAAGREILPPGLVCLADRRWEASRLHTRHCIRKHFISFYSSVHQRALFMTLYLHTAYTPHTPTISNSTLENVLPSTKSLFSFIVNFYWVILFPVTKDKRYIGIKISWLIIACIVISFSNLFLFLMMTNYTDVRGSWCDGFFFPQPQNYTFLKTLHFYYS